MQTKRIGRLNFRNRLLAATALVAVAISPRLQGAAVDTYTTPWSPPTAIVTQLHHAALPTLAYTDDGVAHAVWESEGVLYYSSQRPGTAWTNPLRVAAGIAPSMTADTGGVLHLVFANQFMGDYEIYYVRCHEGMWSLPVNVSRTSGYSARPALTETSDHTLHVTWMDNTPGHWTIYYGTYTDQFWTSQPVPNARGQAPNITISPSGAVYLVWQDRVPSEQNPIGSFEVLLSERGNKNWSLPANVSDSPYDESVGPGVTATSDDVAHVVWVEQDQQVRYSYGQGLYWSVPVTAWTAKTAARGLRILTEHGTVLHVAWDQGEAVWETYASAPPPSWPTASSIASSGGNLKDVTLALMPNSGVAVAWVQASAPGDTAVYESRHNPTLSQHVWLPLLLH